MSWDNRILLKLKRQYSKDETVNWLTLRLAEVEIELGKTKSERDELMDVNKRMEAQYEKRLNKKMANYKARVNLELQKDEALIKYRKKLLSIRKNIQAWQTKYFQVKQKLNKLTNGK